LLDRRTFLAALAAVPQRKPRKADIEVLRLHTLRQEGRITYEGAVKVTAEKPVQGLLLQFEFFESRGVLLSQQKIQIEDATLAPGAERDFHVQGNDVPRAVRFRVLAYDAGGRDLTLSGEGPYPLD
jgi:hypothetical protein